jgi:hypothetical protein
MNKNLTSSETSGILSNLKTPTTNLVGRRTPSGASVLSSQTIPEKKKTIIYIDGFNLYYGCLKNFVHLNRWARFALPTQKNSNLKRRVGKGAPATCPPFYLNNKL